MEYGTYHIPSTGKLQKDKVEGEKKRVFGFIIQPVTFLKTATSFF